MTTPFILRWGILGAGSISGAFVRDAIIDPKTREVADVVHQVVAVGSRDVEKAKEFIQKNAPGSSNIIPYGSYEETVQDKNVDVIYIGTPHTHHYTSTRLALLNGKHVLLEKPSTSNAAELQALIALAKEKGLFLMEAMWTRFLPIAQEISRIVQSGELGNVRVLQADLSGDFDIDNIPLTHRILDPKLGGGALLDLGPYPLVWAIIAMFEDPRNKAEKPSKVTGTMLKTPLTGVDSSTVFVLDFDKIHAQAILSCSITISSPAPALVIRFRKGNIIVPAPIYKPGSFTVQYLEKEGSDKIKEEVKKSFTIPGGGWFYQADEVARCIRDGKKESETWGLGKSVLQMEVFDEVRKQGGYKFPEGVEQV